MLAAPGDVGAARPSSASSTPPARSASSRSGIVSAVTRITGILEESDKAPRQLLPGDPIFDALADPGDVPDIEFATFGGTSVQYAQVYSWHFSRQLRPELRGLPRHPVRLDAGCRGAPVRLAGAEQPARLVVEDEQDDGDGDGLVADAGPGSPAPPTGRCR